MSSQHHTDSGTVFIQSHACFPFSFLRCLNLSLVGLQFYASSRGVFWCSGWFWLRLGKFVASTQLAERAVLLHRLTLSLLQKSALLTTPVFTVQLASLFSFELASSLFCVAMTLLNYCDSKNPATAEGPIISQPRTLGKQTPWSCPERRKALRRASG